MKNGEWRMGNNIQDGRGKHIVLATSNGDLMIIDGHSYVKLFALLDIPIHHHSSFIIHHSSFIIHG